MAAFAMIAALFVSAQPSERASGLAVAAPAQPVPGSPQDLRRLVEDRVNVLRRSPAMVAGAIVRGRSTIIAHARAGSASAPDGDSLFEIGSVTKIFTAVLLADAADRGEVALDDPANLHLPAHLHIPDAGRAVTLLDLATHMSGLPFLPDDLSATDPAAQAAYDEARLSRFLARYRPASAAGAQWNYSNLGMSLLARALSARLRRPYARLLEDRILRPLGMRRTASALREGPRASGSMRGRRADGSAAPGWNAPAFPGAGELRSTANDLLRLLRAALAPSRHGRLGRALVASMEPRRPGQNLRQGLGWWLIALPPGGEIVTAAGQTWGFSATIGLDRAGGRAAVVLANSPAGDGGIAWHAIRPAFPVESSRSMQGRQERREVVVARTALEPLAGRYAAEDGTEVTLELRADGLYLVSAMATAGVRLHAADANRFFIREAELGVSVERDGSGRSSALVLDFAGGRTRFVRAPDRPVNP